MLTKLQSRGREVLSYDRIITSMEEKKSSKVVIEVEIEVEIQRERGRERDR